MRRRLSLLLFLFLTSSAFSQQPVSLALVPLILQNHAAASSGSVASLANAFTSTNLKGNSIVVVFANGNNNAPVAPISDTNGNTYFKAIHGANGGSFEADIWYATNISAGANTVTVTPGGSAASIASEVYEVSGLLALSPQVVDQIASGFSTGTSLTAGPMLPTQANEFAFVGFAVGTAAQTIAVTSPYINDSGQQNPTTPAGLFSFVSGSSFLPGIASSTANATITSEPWGSVIASFRTPALPIGGSTSDRILGNGGATIDATVLVGAAPTNGIGVLSQYNTAPPIPTNTQTVSLQSDWSGNLFVRPFRRAKTVGQATTIAATVTTTTVLAAQGGATFGDIAQLVITVTPSATADIAFTCTLSDGTISYIFDLDTGALATATAVPTPINITFNPPLPATSANTIWTITNSSATPTVHVTVVAVVQKAS